MQNPRILLLALGLVLTSATALGQAGLFTSGGFGAAASFQTGDDVRNVGAALSYVVNPLFEAGVGLSQSSATCTGCDYSATYITPFATLYPVRESETMPVTVFVGGHYHIISVKDAPSGSSESGWGVSAGVSKKIAIAEKLGVHPVARIAYTGFKSESEIGGVTFEFTSNPIYYSVAALFSVPAGPGTFFAGPFFEGWSEDGSSGSQVGVQAGISLTRGGR